jgi:hypothetical protein
MSMDLPQLEEKMLELGARKLRNDLAIHSRHAARRSRRRGAGEGESVIKCQYS